MRNIKLTLEYDGTAYAGWQSQTNARAIQDVVRAAIERMTEERVRLVAASRTDAGVHALGQVAAFQTARDIPCEGFLQGLNSLLPADIRVKICEEVPLDFDPIRQAKRKTYHYLFDTGATPPALNRHRAWWVGPDLDWGAMETAAQCLIGEYDFKSFAAAGGEVKSTVRKLEKVSLRGGSSGGDRMSLRGAPLAGGATKQSPATFFGDCFGLRPRNDMIEFVGNGFLRGMIRNIVGTLVEIGRGRWSAARMAEILAAQDRRLAGPTAPPQGLYLAGVGY